jgi:hypothetical protein
MQNEIDSFTRVVRAVFGKWVSMRKVEALRLELIRAGIVPRDEQRRYEVGPPISPLHS